MTWGGESQLIISHRRSFGLERGNLYVKSLWKTNNNICANFLEEKVRSKSVKIEIWGKIWRETAQVLRNPLKNIYMLYYTFPADWSKTCEKSSQSMSVRPVSRWVMRVGSSTALSTGFNRTGWCLRKMSIQWSNLMNPLRHFSRRQCQANTCPGPSLLIWSQVLLVRIFLKLYSCHWFSTEP